MESHTTVLFLNVAADGGNKADSWSKGGPCGLFTKSSCFLGFFAKRNVDGDDRFALKGSSFSDSDLNSADELLPEHREPLAGNKEQQYFQKQGHVGEGFPV